MVAELIEKFLGFGVPENDCFVFTPRTYQAVVWRELGLFDPVFMASQSEQILSIFDFMDFKCLVV